MTGDVGDRPVRRILLVGMMGAGKTSVGQHLSRRLGWPYRDNDDLVTEIAGTDAATLLERDGKEALRDAESRALHEAVEGPDPVIAGVAGGVVERSADLDLLRSTEAFVVYLHTPLDELVRRVGSGAGRPFLQPDPAAALRRLSSGREPRYREVADIVVDTTEGDPAQQAEEILAAFERYATRQP